MMKATTLIWVVVGLIVLSGGGYVAATQLTRGYRNKNPGNIRNNPKNKWVGQTGVDDKGFCVFEKDFYGLRALAILLRNYEKQGARTVTDIISKYAPSNENNTSAYINSVSRALSVTPNDLVMITPRLSELMAAIVKHENGFNKYSADEISEAKRAA